MDHHARRPFFRVLVAAVLVPILLSGCSSRASGDANARQSVLDSVKATGVLKAGYIRYPPFVLQDPQSGQLSGYFIDLMNRIATEGGFRVEYEETNWGTMVTGLQTHKFDIVVSGVFRTIPRAKEVTFTTPVLYVGLSAIARRGDSRFTAVADLAKPGLTVAVTNGEVGHEYARRFLPNAKLIVMNTEDISRPMLEVAAGRADVALGDSMTAYRFAAAHHDVTDVFAEKPFYVFGTTFMVRRNDPEWLDFLNIAIEQLELSGVTAALETKYKEGATAWISKRQPWQ